MRIAILADIHSNWPALEAVMNDCGEVDEVVCLGDVVGYGGQPKRCMDEVRRNGWLTLVGNHDRACTDSKVLGWFNEDAAMAISWTINQVGPKRLTWLANLPEADVKHGTLLVHASPRDPIYEYILDRTTALINLGMLDGGVCFHGHTHVPGIFRFEDGDAVHEYEVGPVELHGPVLVNPGSVGQPRDGDCDASYGIWDVDSATFDFRRVPYDRERAKRAILRAGLPERFALRLDLGR
jgi:diadenosine tetraphosphatase ApaH/serine/threonine PP2A family protein phosphatase